MWLYVKVLELEMQASQAGSPGESSWLGKIYVHPFINALQDEEDELLNQALDLSMEQEQRRTGKPVARPRRRLARSTRPRDHYVPQSLAGMSEE